MKKINKSKPVQTFLATMEGKWRTELGETNLPLSEWRNTVKHLHNI